MGGSTTLATLPAATSNCAVVLCLNATGTRGVQPRISWAARNAETTTNSNAFDPTGRETTSTSLPRFIGATSAGWSTDRTRPQRDVFN